MDQANRGEKRGLVWRNRKKISQIINDYLYLPYVHISQGIGKNHLNEEITPLLPIGIA
jgi:hypothetical protein